MWVSSLASMWQESLCACIAECCIVGVIFSSLNKLRNHGSKHCVDAMLI